MNIVDMHCDTIGRFYFSGEKGETKEGLLEKFLSGRFEKK